MKFIFGPIPEESDFMPLEAGWQAHKEPTSVLLMTLSIPLAILTGN